MPEYDYLSNEDKTVLESCSQCPRYCQANRFSSRLGFCGCDAGMNISSICVHKGEEPVICGEKGICNVFFSGCNLRCIYCQNFEISRHGEGSRYSYVEALDVIENILKTGVKRVGFVSPSHNIPQVKAIIKGLDNRGLSPITIYNTNGYDKVETIRELEGSIDIFLPDYKYVSSSTACRYSNAADYPEVALKAIKEMYRQKGSTLITDDTDEAINGLIIRHLVLPGCVDESKQALRVIAEELSPGVHLSLMAQYYPTEEVAGHPLLCRSLYKEEYDAVVEEMEVLGFRHGWLQELNSAQTYRPDFSKENPFD